MRGSPVRRYILHQQAVLCGVRKTIYCMYLQNKMHEVLSTDVHD